jgi:hypothetical protein
MSAASAAPSEQPPAPPGEPEQKQAFPSPFTILILVTILVWVAVLFIPSGQYQLAAEGSPIAGSFQEIPSPLDFPDRVAELLLAPVNGLYGIRDPATGQVGPFNSGTCAAPPRCSPSSWRSAGS